MASGINHKTGNFLNDFACQRIKERDGFQLIIKKLKPHGKLCVLSGKHVNGIASDSERTACKIHFATLILHVHQLSNELLTTLEVAGAHDQTHLSVAFRFPNTVNSRDRCHNDGVTSLKNTFCGRQSHLLNMLINCRVFFDKKISARHVRFGLIVVVIRNKVLHCIIGKKFPHFGVKLCGQGLVGSHDDSRNALARNNIGHGKRLSRPRHAQEGLISKT